MIKKFTKFGEYKRHSYNDSQDKMRSRCVAESDTNTEKHTRRTYKLKV